jgi:hypothetical protein
LGRTLASPGGVSGGHVNGHVGVDEYDWRSEGLALVVNVQGQMPDKAIELLHGYPNHRPLRTARSVDAEELGYCGGHDDLVGAAVDEREKFFAAGLRVKSPPQQSGAS